MAIQSINIGNIANDGTGDDLREAFAKVNDNFSELDILVTAASGSEAANIGGGTGIFGEKIGNELQFKSLIGSGINISNSTTEVTLTSNAIDQVLMISDSGSVVLSKGSSSVNLYGGTNINTRVAGTQIFFEDISIVETIFPGSYLPSIALYINACPSVGDVVPTFAKS